MYCNISQAILTTKGYMNNVINILISLDVYIKESILTYDITETVNQAIEKF